MLRLQGYLIKEYFANYFLHMADATFDICRNKVEIHRNHAEPLKVTLVDTGLNTMTVGRLLRIRKYIDGERVSWKIDVQPTFHEANVLTLDSANARASLGWKPRWTLEQTLSAVVSWYKVYQRGERAGPPADCFV